MPTLQDGPRPLPEDPAELAAAIDRSAPIALGLWLLLGGRLWRMAGAPHAAVLARSPDPRHAPKNTPEQAWHLSIAWMLGRGLRAHRGNSVFATATEADARKHAGDRRHLFAVFPTTGAAISWSRRHADLGEVLRDRFADGTPITAPAVHAVLEAAELHDGGLAGGIASGNEVLIQGEHILVRQDLLAGLKPAAETLRETQRAALRRTDPRRARLLDALDALLADGWGTRLMSDLRTGRDTARRPGWLWEQLLFSLITQRSKAGRPERVDGRKGEEAYQGPWRWSDVADLDDDALHAAMLKVMKHAKTGRHEAKAKAMVGARNILKGRGGPDAFADALAWLPPENVRQTLRVFPMIGEKYANNLPMDVADARFEDSVAIDSRMTDVLTRVDPALRGAPYGKREAAALSLAHDLRLPAWFFDRLVYGAYDELIRRLDAG